MICYNTKQNEEKQETEVEDVDDYIFKNEDVKLHSER